MDHMGDPSQGQAGIEGVHLFCSRDTISRGGGGKAASSPPVAARVRAIRGDTIAVVPREMWVVRKGLQEYLNNGE